MNAFSTTQFLPLTSADALLRPRTIVFLDTAALDGEGVLASGLAPGAAGYLLDPARDAFSQMAEVLEARGPFDAVHVVVHGAPGELRFVSGTVDADRLHAAAATFERIASALAGDAAVMLWACEAAQGAAGAAFVDALARMTGARVAAASGLVGHAEQGGAWALDALAVPPFTREALAGFKGVLATVPVLGNLGGTQLYTENTAPVAIDGDLTVTDDGSTLASATVTISAGFTSGDELTFTPVAGITGSFVGNVLTFTGVASVADYQTILRSVSFANSGDDPTFGGAATRTIDWQVNDGSDGPSAIANSTINVTPINDAPVIAVGGAVGYTENTAGTVLDSSITITDADDTSIASAIVKISSGFISGDQLNFTNTATITGTYNSGTGELTLTGTDTIANYQTALESITFSSTSDDPTANATSPTRTISWTVTDANSDGVGAQTSVAGTSNVNVTALNDTPFFSFPLPVPTYTEQSPPVALINPGTLTDADDTNLSGAHVTITPTDFVAGDTLDVTTTGSITKSYDGTTGVLTLSGTDTLANYQTVIESLTYSSTSDDPTADNTHLTRTMTVDVTDANSDAVGAQTATSIAVNFVNLDAVNDAPVLANLGGTVGYTEQASAVTIDNSIALTDADDTQMAGATITIATNFQSGDTLAFTPVGAITGVFAGNTLTLSGTDTIANYLAALQSVTFSNLTNDDPTANGAANTRTINWQVTDANSDADGAQVSNIGSSTIDFTAVNDLPLYVGTSVSHGTYTEGGSALDILNLTGISDADDTQLQSASVTIDPSTFVSGDQLTFTPSGSIVGSYNASTGVLSFSGLDSLANYAAIIDSVLYSSTSDDPTANNDPAHTHRDIAWNITDANSDGVGAASHPITSGSPGFTVAAVDDAPILGGLGSTQIYTEGGAPVALDASITLTDSDDTQMAGATVQITAGLTAGDVLSFTAPVGSGITSSYNSGTGTLTLSGTSSIANYIAALQSVAFQSTSDDPTAITANRTVTWTVTDANSDAVGPASSAAQTSSILILPVDDAPALGLSGSVGYTENGSPVTANPIGGSMTLTDTDDTNMASAQVSIGNFRAGDTLGFTNVGTITGSYNAGTGVLTFTGSDTIANYLSALQSVTYSSTSDDPTSNGTANTRTLSWTVTDDNSDGAGPMTSPVQTTTINVTPLTDNPSLIVSPGLTNYIENGTGAFVLSGATITDADDTQMASATVTISNGFRPGDMLDFTLSGSITGSYDAGTGILSLSGASSIADYQSVLTSVTFRSTSDDPTDNGTSPTRQVSWQVTDANSDSAGAGTSTVQNVSFNVTAVTDNPVLGGLGDSVGYTEQASPVVIDNSITLTDVDDTQMAGATVTISGNFTSGDTLAFTAPGGSGITGSFNNGTGVLSLSGVASIADYIAALQSVTFSNASNDDPTVDATRLTRTIDWQVTDANSDSAGAGVSNVGSSTINFTAVNDVPVLSGLFTSSTYTENGAPMDLLSSASVSDPDDTNLTAATVSISPSTFVAGDVLSFTPVGSITGSYNASTGVLTLLGNDTKANYAAAIDSVTYSSTSDDPTVNNTHTTRGITYTLTDANSDLVGAQTNTQGAISFSVAAAPDAPVLSGLGSVHTYVEGSAPTALDPSISITDVDDTQMASATVAITGDFTAGDQLHFANTATITGSYNASTGVLTLTGVDSNANYEAALESVSYDSTSPDPTALSASRTVTWTVTDANSDSTGSQTSAAQTSQILIFPVGNAPVLSDVDKAAYTENAAPVVLDSNVTITDADDANMASAVVTITNFTAGDVLSFTNTATITGSYNGAGMLTLTGVDTKANYEAALESITYHSTSEDPTVNNATRDVTWTVTDANSAGAGAQTSAVRDSVINITPLTDNPVLGGLGSTAAYTENASPVTLDGSITLSDVDDTQMGSATVSITGGFTAGDVLAFTPVGSITGSYNGATGVLTLSGASSTADYILALQSVRFSSTSDDPTNDGVAPTRTISWSVTDANSDGAGAGTSAVQTSTINVTALTDAPEFNSLTPTASYTENGSAVTLSAGVAVTDVDDANMSGASVSIGGFVAGDQLSFATVAGITGSYNAGTGVLTFTGTASKAAYSAELQSVAFSSASDDPTADGTSTSRSITWGVADANSDGTGTASTLAGTTLNVTPVADVPVLGGLGGTVVYTENGTAVVVDPSITLTDADDANMASASVSIVNFTAGDQLGFTNVGAITGSYNSATGVLTFTGSDTKANYLTALQSVTFGSTSEDPTISNSSRQIAWTVTDANSDGAGAATSTVQNSFVTVTPLNDAPLLGGLGSNQTYTENAAPRVLDPSITLSDVDDAQMASATVAITDNLTAGDVLSFTPVGGITGSYNAGTGILTLSGTSSIANYITALQSVAFSSTSDDPTVDGTSRTFTWNVTDANSDGAGAQTSAPQTSTITITPLPELPVLGGLGDTAGYTEGGTAVTIDNSISLTDGDDTQMASASVSIGAGFTAGDTLAFTSAGGIGGSYNGGTGVLSLTGTATIADYITALQSVTFSSTSDDPTALSASRTIDWAVTDNGSSGFGTTTSLVANSTVNVTAVNQAPVLGGLGGTLSYSENAPAALIDGTATLTDPDDTQMASATVAITGGLTVGDTLAFTAGGGISGSYNAGTGVLSLTGTSSIANYLAALESVTFSSTSEDPTASSATRTVSWTVTDANSDGVGAQSSATQTSTINLTAVADAPVLGGLGSSVGYTENAAPVTLDGSITLTDADDTQMASASVAITGGFTAGDTLAFTAGGGITGSYNAASGILSLSGTSSIANYIAALQSVTYSSTSDDPTATSASRTLSWAVTDANSDGAGAATSATQTSTVNVTAVNDAPVLGGLGSNAGYTENAAAVTLDSSVTLTDSDDAQMASASVAITSGLSVGDTLAFSSVGGITGSYNAGTGVLSLTGLSSVANYISALQSVTFSSSSDNPTATSASRTVTWTVTDANSDGAGPASSTAQTSTIALTAINDAPVNSVPGAQSVLEHVNLSVAGLAVDDIDAGTSSLATTFAALHGTITVRTDVAGGLSGGAISGNGTGTVTLIGSQADINATLSASNGLIYRGGLHYSGPDTLTMTTSDGGATGGGTLQDVDTVALTVNPVAGAALLADRNNDGRTDILWRDSGGAVAEWQMNGLGIAGSHDFGVIAPTWRVVEANGDYNGDGRADVFWRNSDGTVAEWQMNGLQVFGATELGVVPTSWSINNAHADFNGDGRSDVLWRNSDGTVAIWQMNGLAVQSAANLAMVPTSYSIIDANADFNADGKNDILWRNNDGSVVGWQMNGLQVAASHDFGIVSANWNIVDAHADFNGDGKSDVLWRDTSGHVLGWQMNGLNIQQSHDFGVVASSWSILDTHGDYNGDGNNDILWRNSDGTTTIWLMNGLEIANARDLGIMAPTSSLISGHADLNGDLSSDILWRNSDGTVTAWQMNGLNIGAQSNLGPVPLTWEAFDGAELAATLNGDAVNNALVGTLNRDVLFGKGGNDTLTGASGADQFVFDTALNATTNVDTITDFSAGADKLLLSQVIFSNLAPGPLSAANFVAEAGATAHDANDFILFNTTTGTLSYDADGNGAGAAIAFAVLPGSPALTAQDIHVGLI